MCLLSPPYGPIWFGPSLESPFLSNRTVCLYFCRHYEQEADQYTQKGAPFHGTGLVTEATGTPSVHQTGIPSSSSQAATTRADVAHISDTTRSGLHSADGRYTDTGVKTGLGGPVTETEHPIDTTLENPAHDYGQGSNNTGLGHAGLDYGLAETGTHVSGTNSEVPGAEPIGARVARLTAAGAGVVPRTSGTAHPGPSAILTGRPISGEAGATGVDEPHQKKKGLLRKIEDKLTGHH